MKMPAPVETVQIRLESYLVHFLTDFHRQAMLDCSPITPDLLYRRGPILAQLHHRHRRHCRSITGSNSSEDNSSRKRIKRL